MSIVITDDDWNDTPMDAGGDGPAGRFESGDSNETEGGVSETGVAASSGPGLPNYDFPVDDDGSMPVVAGSGRADVPEWTSAAPAASSEGATDGEIGDDDWRLAGDPTSVVQDGRADNPGEAEAEESLQTGASAAAAGGGTPKANAPSPRKHKETHQIGDADVDRLLGGIYGEIRRSGMANMGLPDLWMYMHGTNLDTSLMRPPNNVNAYYQYHGNKYPLLDGRTFTAKDLNYLGVGAGFGARQSPSWLMNWFINQYKHDNFKGAVPSADVLAAAETGRLAYGRDQAWRLTPND
jgi:hypothetical protein